MKDYAPILLTHLETGAAPVVPGLRWLAFGLLFCATEINDVVRFILGVLKPAIIIEPRSSEMDYTNVVFCFQFACAVGLETVKRF